MWALKCVCVSFDLYIPRLQKESEWRQTPGHFLPKHHPGLAQNGKTGRARQEERGG